MVYSLAHSHLLDFSFVPVLGLWTDGHLIWSLHLIGELFMHSLIYILKLMSIKRYDLNSLFNKAFGNFSINVQGLSRVSMASKT